jgi:hypothetical protein
MPGRSDELALRRKATFRAHGRQIVLVKRPYERASHVIMKALLWALHLPQYPDLTVEVSIGDRYKPDVVAMDAQRRPRFWGEAGQVSPSKVQALVQRYRDTHLALAKWDALMAPFHEMVDKALRRSAQRGIARGAPFDLLCFPADSAERFIDARGEIRITHDDLEWRRWD